VIFATRNVTTNIIKHSRRNKRAPTNSESVGEIVKAVSHDDHPRHRGDRAGNIMAVVMTDVAAMTQSVCLQPHVTMLMDLVVCIVSELAHIYNKSE